MAILLLAARLLGVEGFGVYALLLTLVEIIGVVSGFGYGDYLTREVARQPAMGLPLFFRIIQARFLYIVPSVLAAVALLGVLRFSSPVILNLLLFCVALIPRAIGESAQGILKGLRRFAPLAWIEFVQGAAVLTVGPPLISRGMAVRGMVTAEIVAATVGAALAVAAMARFAELPRRETVSLGEVLRATFAFNIYPLLVTTYDRIDVVLLSKLVGNVATGIYSFPYRAYATLGIIVYGVVGALLPAFSSSPSQEEVRRRCSRAMGFLYTIALLAVLGGMAFATPVTLLVLGPSYAASATVLKILVWASVPSLFGVPLLTLLLANGKEKSFIWMAAACTIFNVAANLLLIPRFSYNGAAAVTVLTELLLLAQNLYLVRRSFGRLVLPHGGMSATLAFAACFGGWLLLQRVLPELWAGIVTVSTFAAFAVWKNSDLVGFRGVAEPKS